MIALCDMRSGATLRYGVNTLQSNLQGCHGLFWGQPIESRLFQRHFSAPGLLCLTSRDLEIMYISLTNFEDCAHIEPSMANLDSPESVQVRQKVFHGWFSAHPIRLLENTCHSRPFRCPLGIQSHSTSSTSPLESNGAKTQWIATYV